MEEVVSFVKILKNEVYCLLLTLKNQIICTKKYFLQKKIGVTEYLK